jgi:phosphoglycolate phosphatase-like HAD superfamily hydrolase
MARSVIFDCDGVLVDTELVANRVLAELVSEIGVPAIGRSSAVAPRSLTSASGEEPITLVVPRSQKYMYGDGLSKRRPR